MAPMSEPVPQNFANHGRLDPLFHFFLVPILAVNFFVEIGALVRAFTPWAAWQCVVAAALLAAGLKIRLYALRVQDRVIRLEERLRLTSVLAEPLRSRIGELSEAQLVALRFAAAAELPALVEKTLAGRWKNKQIKQAIGAWRPDHFRV